MRTWALGAALVGLLGGSAGCAGGATLLDDPLVEELPEQLAEVGLYRDLPGLDVVDGRALAYVPAAELWSNGSDKARHLVLPAGGVIDTTERDRWAMPVGTLLFKTFSYPGGAGGTRPVETRLMRRRGDGWQYAVYAWDEAGETASLIDIAVETSVPVSIDGDDLEHEIPSRNACRECHESSAAVPIGVSEIGLGATPALEALADRGLLSSGMPADPATITHPDAETEWLLGYLQGNCAHCHWAGGQVFTPDLRPELALDEIVGVRTMGVSFPGGTRVAPGDPDESLLWIAMSGTGDDPELFDMPPLGVQRRDAQAIARIRAWILALAE